MKIASTIMLIIALCLISSMTIAADQQSAETAIAAAEKARKKAASVDGEWRDTAKFIKQAKAAAKEGKFEKAVKLANFAERQGQYGYEQAESQKTLKIPSYLKY